MALELSRQSWIVRYAYWSEADSDALYHYSTSLCALFWRCVRTTLMGLLAIVFLGTFFVLGGVFVAIPAIIFIDWLMRGHHIFWSWVAGLGYVSLWALIIDMCFRKGRSLLGSGVIATLETTDQKLCESKRIRTATEWVSACWDAVSGKLCPTIRLRD